MAIFTYQNIYRAYLDCRKNKRKTINALKFEMDFEKNLQDLLCELQTKNYLPGRSICFVVTDPKPREIFAADFRDRIVHHLLVRELDKTYAPRFIRDSYACQKGKGTHAAVSRMKAFLQKRENRNIWYLKMDVKGFFVSIDKNILYALNRREILKSGSWSEAEREELDYLLKTIIFHDPTENFVTKGRKELFSLIPEYKSLFRQVKGKGLPIGNYSSQFFANVYLNELDQFVKREIKCRHYIRYVDDFILLGERETLREWRDAISDFLEQTLKAEISSKKTIIQPVKRGIDLLGYFIKPDSIYPRRKITAKYRNKLFRIAVGWEKTNLTYLKSMHFSYMGCLKFRG